jgi:hypothetical protein
MLASHDMCRNRRVEKRIGVRKGGGREEADSFDQAVPPPLVVELASLYFLGVVQRPPTLLLSNKLLRLIAVAAGHL